MTTYELDNLKPLTSTQYDKCKHRAQERILSRIGERPKRDAFKREYSALWNVLDLPMLVIFVGALLVSMLHIFDYASISAGKHYATVDYITGIRFGHWWYVAIQQVAYLLMAEFAMLSFFTVWRVQAHQDQSNGWQRFAYLSFWLAVIAAVFVMLVNIFGGGGFNLAGLLPPLFTVGIGLRLEEILSEAITRRDEIDRKYLHALESWHKASEDPTQHKEYLPILYGEIWQYLTVTLTRNADFQEAPPAFRVRAVERELERERWAFAAMQGKNTSINPTQAPSMNTPPSLELASMNGNGVKVKAH